MVRFKPIALSTKGGYTKNVTIPLWFDSNSQTKIKNDLIKLKSQFHYGSIQTIFIFLTQKDSSGCHNSTMVRFKLFMELLSCISPGDSHNSTMVRFKLNAVISIRDEMSSHNSTMVRFKLS